MSGPSLGSKLKNEKRIFLKLCINLGLIMNNWWLQKTWIKHRKNAEMTKNNTNYMSKKSCPILYSNLLRGLWNTGWVCSPCIFLTVSVKKINFLLPNTTFQPIRYLEFGRITSTRVRFINHFIGSRLEWVHMTIFWTNADENRGWTFLMKLNR